jgi:hypothetical protein
VVTELCLLLRSGSACARSDCGVTDIAGTFGLSFGAVERGRCVAERRDAKCNAVECCMANEGGDCERMREQLPVLQLHPVCRSG